VVTGSLGLYKRLLLHAVCLLACGTAALRGQGVKLRRCPDRSFNVIGR